jgi:hypothetical protein
MHKQILAQQQKRSVSAHPPAMCRHTAGHGRAACAWLIVRFVDPDAELFVTDPDACRGRDTI